MKELIELKVKEIISNNIESGIQIEKIDLEDDLSSIGINSLTFMKIIVALEAEFNIEFEEESFDFDNYFNIKQLVDYIYQKKNK